MVDYHLQTLDNGLRVVAAHCPTWRSLAMGIFAGTGSRHDPARKQGLAHFTEHMLFKGTKRRTPKRIVVQAESVGGSLNAYTSEEHTCYHLRSPANHLNRMVDLLADIYIDSTFPEGEIGRERQVIEDEILMYRDEPSSHVDDVLSQGTWPKESLGRPILGSVETLSRIGRDDFLRYLKQAYGAKNSVIALAGPQEPEAMVATVAKAFDPLPKGRRQNTKLLSKIAKPLPDAQLAIEERPTEQVHLRLAFLMEGRDHPQLCPSRLLSVMLGETMSSRLSQEVREKRGYCYSIGSSRDVYTDTGLFSIYASCEPRFLRPLLKQTFRQLKRLRDQAPSARELKAAFQYVAGNHDMGLEETSTQMFWIGDAALHEDEDLNPERYLDDLRRVTPEDIQQTAKDIFTTASLRLALLGPDLENLRPELLALCHDQ
ncbi:MAG: hypothetical protein GWQ08_07560 [Verrucomicrobiaceae bacterium]|nr:hypothetical protein [Verrucomicrobiaceae bacterium]